MITKVRIFSSSVQETCPWYGHCEEACKRGEPWHLQTGGRITWWHSQPRGLEADAGRVREGWTWLDSHCDLKTKLLAKRFGLQQGEKVRLIDDCTIGGFNGTCGLGSVSAFLRISMAVWFLGFVDYVCVGSAFSTILRFFPNACLPTVQP